MDIHSDCEVNFVENMSTTEDYVSERNNILKKEENLFLGSSLQLDERESKLDSHILDLKSNELKLSYQNSQDFLPKKNFFESKKDIDNSKIFKILKKLPKGHSLHSHLLASGSIDFIITNITYRENVYGKFINDQFKIKFLRKDEAKENGWVSLQEMRRNKTNFDDWLKQQLSLMVDCPRESYPSLESVWKKFKGTFSAVYDMFSYKPAFEDYYYQCLKELYEDNVMYVEFRATPMPFYDLKGGHYETEDFFKTMIEVEENFKKGHSDFIGARYIHSIYRGISLEDLRKELKDILEMKEKFPKLIVGLDFVGFEEEGHSLVDFHEDLMNVREKLDFFFHAGETNWFGHTDCNLVDAVLMKSKRIGHGFALSRHPQLMNLVFENNIAIEHCPISNQVLLLNDDPRNHPIIPLLSKGFPVVICNDDPAVWGATGLSYDWYVTFLAMTPKKCGLKVLKQFALNSIRFSALDDGEKKNAMDVWSRRWDNFLSEILKDI
ncbi:adenosine deaminase 2-like [Coccinella septempunctata]|uniref:adenosine deaminase 2-like n=1 Tax=Coccinella septempunctata TaxID=41139 RepID=UPI001D06DE59|nr:adenosine deaminase 2-like [Coccinella septempunctata]